MSFLSISFSRNFVFVIMQITIGLFSTGYCKVDESSLTPGEARRMIVSLANKGSESSYLELKQFFQNPDAAILLYQPIEGGGGHLGNKAIDRMLKAVGAHQNDRSYRLLETFLKSEYDENPFRGFNYGDVIRNLSKFRDIKEKDLIATLKEELDRLLNDKGEYEKRYPFVKDDSIFFDHRSGEYIKESGEFVHKNRIYDPRTNLILEAFNSIGSDEAYGEIKSFLTSSWIGRESIKALEFPEYDLKKRRYDLPVIEIYEALIRDKRYPKASRANFVKNFFDNSTAYYVQVEHPEQVFAQIDSASENALLRMLDVADYSLSLEFLPTETVDLVYKKRAEIIDRLVGMGYSREELNKVGDDGAAEVQADEEAMQPKPASERAGEVATAEPPAEQPSLWWLWLVGTVVAVGCLGLIVRQKS